MCRFLDKVYEVVGRCLDDSIASYPTLPSESRRRLSFYSMTLALDELFKHSLHLHRVVLRFDLLQVSNSFQPVPLPHHLPPPEVVKSI